MYLIFNYNVSEICRVIIYFLYAMSVCFVTHRPIVSDSQPPHERVNVKAT